MTRILWGIGLTLLTLISTAARVHAQAEGNWRVSYMTGPTEITPAIVKVSVQDGKATGELVASRPGLQRTEFISLTQTGPSLRIVLKSGTLEMTFEAAVPKKDVKVLTGSMEMNGAIYPAAMTLTEDATLDAKSAARPIDCAPMVQARTLLNRPLILRNQANLSKDPEKKKDLLQQAAEADKTAKAETPKLYREVLDKHADSPAVFEASLNLIRAAKASAANPGDVKAWAATGAATAKKYGPRMEGEYASQLVGALISLDGMEKLSLEYGRVAEKSLTDKSPAADQIRILGMLVRALKKTGNEEEAKSVDGRIEKLEVVLDREYAKKMPGFKGAVYEGRKSKSERAVFMELFTGATCPPCVAADLAFDVLQKSYKQNELVLIQYHMHIPGPDPMTNPDTEARWSYYSKAFPGQVRGVPSSIFNGKPKAGGGGAAANAEAKYGVYRGVIDELIEENAGAKLTAVARRDGDRIDINVKVTDLNEPGANKKLRILLAEETIRYAGSNKIRLHHNVVRAFPGGVAGVALSDAASRHKASINVGELRTSLTKYLDNYEANFRPFANPARPLAMSHLRVIAFVQDDATQEVLQAVQVAVDGK
jgi:hypothetical protein